MNVEDVLKEFKRAGRPEIKLQTQDDIAAACVKGKAFVFAFRGPYALIPVLVGLGLIMIYGGNVFANPTPAQLAWFLWSVGGVALGTCVLALIFSPGRYLIIGRDEIAWRSPFSTTVLSWTGVELRSKVFPGRSASFGIVVMQGGKRRRVIVPKQYKCWDLPRIYWEHGLSLVLQYYARLAGMATQDDPAKSSL